MGIHRQRRRYFQQHIQRTWLIHEFYWSFCLRLIELLENRHRNAVHDRNWSSECTALEFELEIFFSSAHRSLYGSKNVRFSKI